MEAAVPDLPERPVALTFFRSTRRTVMTDGEPGGQEQGELTFQYWIAPLHSAPDRASLLLRAQRLAGSLRTAQLTAADAARFRPDRPLPPEASFLRVDGPVTVTSLRREGDGLEVRMFNPNTRTVEAALDLTGWPADAPRPQSCIPVNLESDPVGQPYPVEDGRVEISLEPKQIVTLRFLAV
jgi:hypothetical protein